MKKQKILHEQRLIMGKFELLVKIREQPLIYKSRKTKRITATAKIIGKRTFWNF